MSTNLHEHLRSGTREQHERLHELMDLTLALHSIRSYGAALVAYLRALSGPEQALSELCRSVASEHRPPNADMRFVKTAWLRADLSAVEFPVEEITATVDSKWQDPSRASATLIGFSYVMEGMTLGATRMQPRVEQALGLTPDHGARFFSAYGEATMSMWSEYKQWLSECTAPVDEVLEAAKFCFCQFEHEFKTWKGSETELSKDPLHHG